MGSSNGVTLRGRCVERIGKSSIKFSTASSKVVVSGLFCGMLFTATGPKVID